MIQSINKKIENSILSLMNVDRFLPLQIDITNACNLRCKHCYHPHHENDGAIGFSDWMNIIDQYEALIDRLGFRPYLIICGGEPLLSKHFEPILLKLMERKRAYRLSILTNGTIIDDAKISLLKRFKDVSVQVSLDGPNEAAHDLVRGKGNFQRSLKGIALLRENNIHVQLLAVLSKRSASAIGAFFDLAKSLQVNGMGFTRLVVEGQAKSLVSNSEDRPLEPLELRDAYRSMVSESARTSIKTSTNSPLFHLVYPGLGRNGKFWESIIIDYKGNYLASSRSRLVLGNVLNERIENIFLCHPLLQRLRKRDIKVCGTCPHYAICGGDRNAAYATTGDFLGADPGCWLPLPKQKLHKEKHICA